MHLDILAFGAHPDDIELGAGGTLAKHASNGFTIGLVDLTLGEMGTRGTPDIRLAEAAEAARILGASARHNLYMRDGFFAIDEYHIRKVVEVIRLHTPKWIICNAISDRHPDHGRAAKLLVEASFISGLKQFKTQWQDKEQQAFRPQAVYHYIQFLEITPDLVVDISGYEKLKMQSVLAHKSQFYDANSQEPETVISSKGFLESVEYRAKNFGRLIGTDYGEGFTVERLPGVNWLSDLI